MLALIFSYYYTHFFCALLFTLKTFLGRYLTVNILVIADYTYRIQFHLFYNFLVGPLGGSSVSIVINTAMNINQHNVFSLHFFLLFSSVIYKLKYGLSEYGHIYGSINLAQMLLKGLNQYNIFTCS